jgi:hypothetical protein
LAFELDGGAFTPYTLAEGAGALELEGTAVVDGLAEVVEGLAEVVDGAVVVSGSATGTPDS